MAQAPLALRLDQRSMSSYLEEAKKQEQDEQMEKVFEELQETNSLVLSYQNMEKLTLWYRKAHVVESDQLADTLAAMHAGRWRCEQEVLAGGIPQAYYDQLNSRRWCTAGAFTPPSSFGACARSRSMLFEYA